MSVIINYQGRKPKGPSITSFPEVEKLALRSGLTANTVQMLKDRGYGSVKTFRDITESDVSVLPLYVGQQLALLKLVNHVNEVLAGFVINDSADGDGEEDGEDADPQGDEEEALTAEERAQQERDEILDRINKAGILSLEEYADGTCGPRTLPRPHDFLVGRSSGKGLYLEEFLYGSLLILEYFIETSEVEVRPFMKHLRFMVLKLLHGYPLNSIISYDYALRKKIEREQLLMPKDPDDDLLERYLRLMKQTEVIKKKKKTTKAKTKKKAKVK